MKSNLLLETHIVRAKQLQLCRFPFATGATPRELSPKAREFALLRADKAVESLPPALEENPLPENFLSDRVNMQEMRNFLPDGWEKLVGFDQDFQHAFRNCATILITNGIIKLLEDVENPKILQVGCSWGPLLAFLNHSLNVEVYGLDQNPDAIYFAKECGFDFVYQGIIENIPFKDNSFDLVLTRSLLCYEYWRPYIHQFNWDKRAAFMKEFHAGSRFNSTFLAPYIIRIFDEVSRVIKPGGIYLSAFEAFAQPKYLSKGFSSCMSDREKTNYSSEGYANFVVARK